MIASRRSHLGKQSTANDDQCGDVGAAAAGEFAAADYDVSPVFGDPARRAGF